MRKGWEAIAKRGDAIRPWFYAQIVKDAVCSAERMDRFPPPEQIETFRELTSKVQSLSQDFDDALVVFDRLTQQLPPPLLTDAARRISP